MSTQSSSTELKKSVSFFGLVALGLGGVWGTSWLVMAGSWFDLGGGVVNVLLAWLVIAVVELPFVLAYRQAVPLFPDAEGEMSYATAAFGRSAGFWAAWFGILVNLIVCGYEVVALVRMAGYLWPGIKETPSWYTLQGSEVGPVTIVLGLLLVGGLTALHLRGVNLSSTITKFITMTLMILTGLGIVLAVIFGDIGNWQPLFGKPAWQGVIAVAVLLPFSFAGWESIAKGAEEANDSSTSGKAVPVAWGSGWTAYVLSIVASGLVLPWMVSAQDTMPFATGLSQVTGVAIAGKVLVFAALLGVVGVYNVLFYSVTRQLFGMARRGMLPGWLAKVDPETQTPRRAILFVTCILLIAPFLGRGFLLPLVVAASFAYIVLWGLTFLSIVVLGRRDHKGDRRYRLPGGIATEILGFFAIVFMIASMVHPASPGKLMPVDWAVLGVLIAIGVVLYLVSGRRAAPVTQTESTHPVD